MNGIVIQAGWLSVVIFLAILGVLGYQLWRSGRPLSLDAALKVVRAAGQEGASLYQVIRMGVMMAQERKRTGKIQSGAEAKRVVTEYVLRHYPNVNKAELSETIDGIYWAVNAFGDKLPDVQLQGAAIFDDDDTPPDVLTSPTG